MRARQRGGEGLRNKRGGLEGRGIIVARALRGSVVRNAPDTRGPGRRAAKECRLRCGRPRVREGWPAPYKTMKDQAGWGIPPG